MEENELSLFEMRTSHLSNSELERLKQFMNYDLSDANHREMEYWLMMREARKLGELDD